MTASATGQIAHDQPGQDGADWKEGMAGMRRGEASLRGLALASAAVIAIGFGGLTGWAALAKLDSAVPATGMFVAAGKRKTISILEPGILRAVSVHEGDHVKAGQVLVELDDVQARATREQARLKLWGLTARAERLQAEAADNHELVFGSELLREAAAHPAVASQVEGERHQFDARWRAYEDLLRLGMEKLRQAQAQIPILRAQETSLTARLALTRTETATTEGLYAQHLVPRSSAVGLRLNSAELAGQLAQVQGQLLGAESAIKEATQNMAGAVSSRHSDISKDLADAEGMRSDAVQADRIARDVLEHRVILAPEDGIVTDMKLFTPGSSVPAGQPILDIVPEGALLIEASVPPNEIEHVAVGQRVNVRLTAYKSHKVPVITGSLVYVAADRTLDPQGQPVFLARATLDPGVLAKLDQVTVYAGMPADVLILGGRRTVLDFLLSPISDNMRHGMREE